MSIQNLQGKYDRDFVGTSFCNKEENLSRLYASMEVIAELCKKIWKEGRIKKIKVISNFSVPNAFSTVVVHM